MGWGYVILRIFIIRIFRGDSSWYGHGRGDGDDTPFGAGWWRGTKNRAKRKLIFLSADERVGASDTYAKRTCGKGRDFVDDCACVVAVGIGRDGGGVVAVGSVAKGFRCVFDRAFV